MDGKIELKKKREGETQKDMVLHFNTDNLKCMRIIFFEST